MKRRYTLFIIFSLLFFFITSTAWSELSTAKPEDVGLSSERLSRISATLKAHVEKGGLHETQLRTGYTCNFFLPFN